MGTRTNIVLDDDLMMAGTGVIADGYDPKNLFQKVPHVAEPPQALSKRPAAKKRSLPKRW